MLTDRELLALAAKAAGIKHALVYDAYPEDGFPTAYAKTSKRTYWNPLTDDGDALRLAVVMGFNVFYVGPYVYVEDTQYSSGVCVHEKFDDDDINSKLAATRRAIVRSAAAIGQAMQ